MEILEWTSYVTVAEETLIKKNTPEDSKKEMEITVLARYCGFDFDVQVKVRGDHLGIQPISGTETPVNDFCQICSKNLLIQSVFSNSAAVLVVLNCTS